MEWFKEDDKMSVLYKARACLQDFNKNMTAKQRRLLATSDYEAGQLSSDENYDRIRLKTYVEGLNRLINIHENMPPPQDPQVPLRKEKDWEPTNYRSR